MRVRDALADALPEGDSSIDGFAFGGDASASVFDAVFRKLVTFNHGVKSVINKRVAGVAKRMTPKQKAAFAMVRRKSHSSKANLMRAKSVKKRIGSGIGMKRKRA